MTNTSIRFWRVHAPVLDEVGRFYYRKQDAESASAKLRLKGGQPVLAEFWLDTLRKSDVVHALNTWPKR